jgi:RNA polymerase sigma-70 factor (ECF subfamily)
VDGEERFRDLFTSSYRPVHAFFRRRAVSADEADELTQETFLRVYRGMEAFRGGASERTWVLRIALNIWSNHQRYQRAKGRAVPSAALDDVDHAKWVAVRDLAEAGEEPRDLARALNVPSVAPSPLETLVAREQRELLREAIAELPSQMRRCVILRVGQGLKYREIAAVAGVSIDTVKVMLHDAKQRLRARLAGRFADVGFATLEEE